MPFKSVERRRQYQREYYHRRKKRSVWWRRYIIDVLQGIINIVEGTK